MKKNMNIRVYCERAGRSGMAFYAEHPAERLFLFQTEYYDDRIFQFYKNGLRLQEVIATDCKKGNKRNPVAGLRMNKTKERIIRMLRWAEREYRIPIFWPTERPFRDAV